jgi:hypothetical protein
MSCQDGRFIPTAIRAARYFPGSRAPVINSENYSTGAKSECVSGRESPLMREGATPPFVVSLFEFGHTLPRTVRIKRSKVKS